MIRGTVEINGLRLRANHGVMDQERRVGNIFEVTVHVHYPFEEAMRRDNASATLNYAVLVEVVKDVMATPSALLENVAWRIHEAIMARFHAVQGGMIKVSKLTPPISAQLDSAAVTIEW